MKLQSDLIKLIAFILCTGILTRCLEYYIILSHLTVAAIVSGTILELFGVYLSYRMILQ